MNNFVLLSDSSFIVFRFEVLVLVFEVSNVMKWLYLESRVFI
jgi:hypothetical protein